MIGSPTRTVVAVTLLAGLAACASWRRHPASSDFGAADQRPLRLFVTGDIEGFLAPCDCETGQYGGLARRATYLRKVRRPGDVRVDLGNIVVGDSPQQRIVLAYALDGLKSMEYDALVPGEGEVRMGKPFEDAVSRHAELRVIAANLQRADGARVFEPWLLRRLPDGRAVAVVGVVAPIANPPEGYRIAPVDEAVRAAVVELRGKADVVVVAGALREPATLALAAQFHDVALVVGGWQGEGSRRVVSTAGAPAILVGEFAWTVSRVDFDETLRIADSWQAWLDAGVPDDPDAAGIIARYKAETSQTGGEFSARLVQSLREQGFVGSETCAECHAAESATWHASAHSHAMHTLVGKKAERNPTCVACHLLDVTPPPADATPGADVETLGIGCEGCHGGAARHVDLARRGSEGAAKALAPATHEACVRCHTKPNATQFDFDRDWPKIAHGRATAR